MEFVALLRFIAAGEESVGHLWKGSKVIHRTGVKDDEVQYFVRRRWHWMRTKNVAGENRMRKSMTID